MGEYENVWQRRHARFHEPQHVGAKTMKGILILFALLVPALAVSPSDLITVGPHTGLVALSGASANSMVAIDHLNSNLSPFAANELTDLGHYYSGTRAANQDIDVISPVQLAFIGEVNELPANVGNDSLVVDANSSLIWVV